MQLLYTVNTLKQNDNATWLSIYNNDIPKNGSELKKKVLLFDKELLDKGLTESTIQKLYKYPFKIVSREEIEKVILNRE